MTMPLPLSMVQITGQARMDRVIVELLDGKYSQHCEERHDEKLRGQKHWPGLC